MWRLFCCKKKRSQNDIDVAEGMELPHVDSISHEVCIDISFRQSDKFHHLPDVLLFKIFDYLQPGLEYLNMVYLNHDQKARMDQYCGVLDVQKNLYTKVKKAQENSTRLYSYRIGTGLFSLATLVGLYFTVQLIILKKSSLNQLRNDFNTTMGDYDNDKSCYAYLNELMSSWDKYHTKSPSRFSCSVVSNRCEPYINKNKYVARDCPVYPDEAPECQAIHVEIAMQRCLLHDSPAPYLTGVGVAAALVLLYLTQRKFFELEMVGQLNWELYQQVRFFVGAPDLQIRNIDSVLPELSLYKKGPCAEENNLVTH